jgi:hypothetical protein
MRRILPKGAVALGVLLPLAGCGGAPAPVSEAERARAAEALEPLKRELLVALTHALQEGGPENAIGVCRLRAPEVAASLSGDGLEVGRTSHRLRNPDNAPEPWMEPLLQAYLDHPTDTRPRTARLPDGRLGYVEPIRMKSMCLPCHGPEPDEGVMEKLAELYPEDRATGFEPGDLRGMFWVKLPAEGGVS